MAGQIVVVGSLNMDLVVRSPRHPNPGETLLGGEFRTFPGGKGANQAVAAARMGGNVNMIGKVGTDDFGAALLENLRANNVDTTGVGRDSEAATGVALITVSDDGQNTIVVAQGANGRLSSDDVAAAAPLFAGARVLLLQLEIPVPAIERAIAEAKKRNVAIVLNPAPARELDVALLGQVDYLVPNQHELALLTGESDLQAGVAKLRGLGVRTVLVTLGGDGVLIANEDGNTIVPPHKVNVVDTTAAGDAFVGAFGAALASGKSALEAVHWGNAAGAITVTRAGAQPSLALRSEVDALLAAVKDGKPSETV